MTCIILIVNVSCPSLTPYALSPTTPTPQKKKSLLSKRYLLCFIPVFFLLLNYPLHVTLVCHFKLDFSSMMKQEWSINSPRVYSEIEYDNFIIGGPWRDRRGKTKASFIKGRSSPWWGRKWSWYCPGGLQRWVLVYAAWRLHQEWLRKGFWHCLCVMIPLLFSFSFFTYWHLITAVCSGKIKAGLLAVLRCALPFDFWAEILISFIKRSIGSFLFFSWWNSNVFIWWNNKMFVLQ